MCCYVMVSKYFIKICLKRFHQAGATMITTLDALVRELSLNGD